MTISKEVVWVEKYRPTTIEETILPATLKNIFKGYASKGEIPNMILSGNPGMGKTTVAYALCRELGVDVAYINGSLDRNLDTVRTKILTFASTKSMLGNKRKVVFIDEADNLNGESSQLALRGVIEEFSAQTSFIFTCNFKDRLLGALQSRLPCHDFTIPKDEQVKLMKQILDRVIYILEQEKIPYDKPALVGLIKKHFPDMRRIIGEVQKYSAAGKVDVGILTVVDTEVLKNLFMHLKAKNFRDARKCIADLNDDTTVVYNALYNNLNNIVAPQSVPAATVLIGQYQYKNAFAVNKEINTAALFAEMMIECDMLENGSGGSL